jgi:hypothetical protein
MTHFFEHVCLQLRNNAPSSASVAEAIAKWSIEQSVKKALLNFIGLVRSGLQHMKKCQQA